MYTVFDGSGRTARTINGSQLYFAGFPKDKIDCDCNGNQQKPFSYYKSIRDCEIVLDKKKKGGWLDLSPFVDYMQTMFEEA